MEGQRINREKKLIDLETFLEPIDQVQYDSRNGEQAFFTLNKAGCKYLEDVEISYQEMFVDWSNAQIFLLNGRTQITNIQSALFHQQEITAKAKRDLAIMTKENEQLREIAKKSIGKNQKIGNTTEELIATKKKGNFWRTVKDVAGGLAIAGAAFLAGSN